MGITWHHVWSEKAKIYGVVHIKSNQLVYDNVHTITSLPIKRIKRCYSNQYFQSFTYKVAAKTGRHRYGTKLRQYAVVRVSFRPTCFCTVDKILTDTARRAVCLRARASCYLFSSTEDKDELWSANCSTRLILMLLLIYEYLQTLWHSAANKEQRLHIGPETGYKY